MSLTTYRVSTPKTKEHFRPSVRARVIVGRRDTFVHRKPEHRKPSLSLSHIEGHNSSRAKAPKTEQSRKSQRRLSLTVRNCEATDHIITLTYGNNAPSNDKTTKKHLDRVLTWLRRQNIKGVWAQEFTKEGRPHFHMLTVGTVDVNELRATWARITDQDATPHIADVQNIERLARVEVYIAKHTSKTVPQDYENMGRFFGTFGGIRQQENFKIEGTEQEIAPVVRIVKKIHGARLKSSPRNDRGVHSFTVWNLSSPSLIADLERYWNALKTDPRSHSETIAQRRGR